MPRTEADPGVLGMDLDENVAGLVRALNRLPAVHTASSCGGHPDPGRGQVPDGEFYVDMYVDPTPAAFRSLELIAWTDPVPEDDYQPADAPRFNLRGRNGYPPEKLAQIIEEIATDAQN